VWGDIRGRLEDPEEAKQWYECQLQLLDTVIAEKYPHQCHSICDSWFRQLLVDEFEGRMKPRRGDAPVSKMTTATGPSTTTRQRIKPSKERQLHTLQEEESETKVHRRVHDALADELAGRTKQLKQQNLAIQELIRKDSKVWGSWSGELFIISFI
jgi:hypothetical protein